MQVTDELRVLVEAEVARAIENFNKLGASVDSTEQKTQSLGEALDSVSKKSVLVSAAIGGAGIAAVKFAGDNEKLKLSLKNMLGSADEASAVFEDWRKLGASPGLSTDEVFDLGRAMVNMGHDTAYATQTIQMLGDVAAGTGKSFGTVSGAFEHARAQGKLTTRDLVSLQQQGIPILKQLAKELKTSEDGVRQMAAQGKIGFSDLEKAFRSMTGPGGQFAGMMNELSGTTLEKFKTASNDAKQALASFGELMLPMATDLLDGASSILRGITDMDEGTKRFVLGMGGVVAISGPAIAAIKGVTAAMTVAAANPYILAIGGTIAVAGIIAGVINKQAHAYEDLQNEIKKTNEAAKGLLETYAGSNDAKTLDEKTTRELIKLYPELSKQIKANATTVKEAAAAQEAANAQRVMDGEKKHIKELKIYQGELAKINAALDQLENSRGYYSDEYLEEYNKSLAQVIDGQQLYLNKIYELQNEINKALAPVNKKYTLAGDFMDIEIPVKLSVDTTSLDTPPEAIKKRWQDWYGEITKIDPASFGDSGAQAAELYIAEFSRSFEAGKTVFTALGEEFDIAGSLRDRQGEIQKALVEMFSINPADIDRSFEAASEPVKQLIAEYKRLTPEIKTAEDTMKAAAAQKEYTQKIDELRQKIADFGKSEVQLAHDTAVANKALPEQAAEIANLTGEFRRTEIIAEYDRQIKELTMTEKELAMETFAATGATLDQLTAFSQQFDLRDKTKQAKELEKTLEGIRESLVNLGAGATLTGIETLGSALGKGANAGDAMREALVAMHMEILNALPNLFLQAGLQLISQGQWPLGLGFIAAAGSTAMIKGYVNGRIESEQAAAQANAHGNIFDADGIHAFAHGETFTNQIVQKPTLFAFARGTGLMGEAGPEAIVPLKRMANGDLGVTAANGGGANVTVTIINNTGAEVQTEETVAPDGSRQLEITVGGLIDKHIASGKADRVMNSRYGLRAPGV